MTNLYLLALIELKRPENWADKFSFFQIAGEFSLNSQVWTILTFLGIHGKPYAPWDDVSPDWDNLQREQEELRRNIPNRRAGYCSHGSNLFPTWHRKLKHGPSVETIDMLAGAYLAMLEQSIFLKMVDIAEAFPEPHRAQYLEAADRFGLPYCEIVTIQVDIFARDLELT